MVLEMVRNTIIHGISGIPVRMMMDGALEEARKTRKLMTFVVYQNAKTKASGRPYLISFPGKLSMCCEKLIFWGMLLKRSFLVSKMQPSS